MEAKKKKLMISLGGGLLLYLVSSGLSFAAFRYLAGPVVVAPLSPLPGGDGLRVDLTKPKTEACPLNGGMFTKAEKDIWEKRRPLTVMIENHEDSRPQSGLSRADVVYEAIAEGGITRFMAVYLCGSSAQDITVGPVRSARTYFMDFASEYADYPLYAHVGGANLPGPANALGQISDYGWLNKGNDLNQFSLGFPTFWRDYERIGHVVATEHTMYSTTDRLWEVAEERGLAAIDDEGEKWDAEFISWPFKDDAKEKGSVAKIEYSFWDDAPYNVSWEYDVAANTYRRSNGGQAHQDLNNDEQLTAKVVVVVLMKEKGPLDAEKHLLYTTTGSGSAFIFQDGEVTKGTWRKEDRQSRMIFADAGGREVKFNRGLVWLSVLPTGNTVNY